MNAPTREDAEKGIERFEADYGAKYPKAITSLRREQDRLLSYFDFPAEHWKHIRTSKPYRVHVRNGSAEAARDQRPGLQDPGTHHGPSS